MLKKLHLEPKNSSESWSSCCWRPESAFTHHPWGLRRGQGHSGLPKQLSFCSNFTFSYSRCGSLLGGRQGYGTLEFSIPQLSVVQQTHSDSTLGQCNTMIQGHQALRGGPKNLWPRDYWEKKNKFEGFSSVFRNRIYLRRNLKVHCWKKIT